MTGELKGANAKSELNSGFRIDEERLRRILSIIKESCDEQLLSTITIRVGRTDGLSFETSNVDDVAAEENFSSERIDRIAIRAADESIELNLEFYDGDTKLRVEGMNRNTVQVLNSRLHTFLRDDVCLKKGFPRKIDRIIYPISMLMAIPFMLIALWMQQPNEEMINKVRSSSDILEKMNFLVWQHTESKRGGVAMYIPFVLITFVLVFMLGGGERLLAFFFPRSVFLFGKERERFQKMIALRSQVGWVIGVGFLVSFVASLVLWLMTS